MEGSQVEARRRHQRDEPADEGVGGKGLRAVNALLATKKEPAVDMKALFEGVAAKPGKKAKEVVKPGCSLFVARAF